MTQDERWDIRYQEVMDFIETNHRLPGDRYLAAIARLLLPGTCPHGSPMAAIFLKKM